MVRRAKEGGAQSYHSRAAQMPADCRLGERERARPREAKGAARPAPRALGARVPPLARAAAARAATQVGPGNYFEDIGAIISFRRSWSVTAMTWPVVPWGLARILVHISTKYKPAGGIYIAENGVAVAGEDALASACDVRKGRPGARRISYVRSHLTAVQRAIGAGADVRGYFLWSFMDNFECAPGRSRARGGRRARAPCIPCTTTPPSLAPRACACVGMQVGLWLREALRRVPRRLQDARAHAQARGGVVQGRRRAQRRARAQGGGGARPVWQAGPRLPRGRLVSRSRAGLAESREGASMARRVVGEGVPPHGAARTGAGGE